jgi:hypothetical protein
LFSLDGPPAASIGYHFAVHRSRSLGLCLAGAVAWSGCSSEQVAAPSPPGSANRPPVVESILPATNRAEVGTELALVAVVQDQETNPDDLEYEWSATGGTLSGTGPRVRWRAPVSATPPSHEIALTVVERYTSSEGRPQAFENRTKAAVNVYVNNTPAELSALAFTFIHDFIHPERTPPYCVRNFSDGCRGKTDELGDIVRNRAEFVIKPDASAFSLRSLTFNTPGNTPEQATFATVRVNCHFVSTRKATGLLEMADGTCRLTNVYENFRWRLCESLFDPPAGVTSFFIF